MIQGKKSSPIDGEFKSTRSKEGILEFIEKNRATRSGKGGEKKAPPSPQACTRASEPVKGTRLKSRTSHRPAWPRRAPLEEGSARRAANGPPLRPMPRAAPTVKGLMGPMPHGTGKLLPASLCKNMK